MLHHIGHLHRSYNITYTYIVYIKVALLQTRLEATETRVLQLEEDKSSDVMAVEERLIEENIKLQVTVIINFCVMLLWVVHIHVH